MGKWSKRIPYSQAQTSLNNCLDLSKSMTFTNLNMSPELCATIGTFCLYLFNHPDSLILHFSNSRHFVRFASLLLRPPRLDVPPFVARCRQGRSDARDLSSERWNIGRERFPGNSANMASLSTPLRNFYMSQIYDMEPTALFPLRRNLTTIMKLNSVCH